VHPNLPYYLMMICTSISRAETQRKAIYHEKREKTRKKSKGPISPQRTQRNAEKSLIHMDRQDGQDKRAEILPQRERRGTQRKNILPRKTRKNAKEENVIGMRSSGGEPFVPYGLLSRFFAFFVVKLLLFSAVNLWFRRVSA
jgi:hypothetical protein